MICVYAYWVDVSDIGIKNILCESLFTFSSFEIPFINKMLFS